MGPTPIDDISLKILEMADTVLLVCILSVSSLTNIKRLFEKFVGLTYPMREKVQIIINRYQKHSLLSLNEVEQIIGRKTFWQIPNDFPATISAIHQGKPLSQVGARAGICKSFRGLTSLFLESGQQEKEMWTEVAHI